MSGEGGVSEAAEVAPGAAVLGRWAAAPHPQALQGGVGTLLMRRGAALRAPATSAERFAVLRGTLVTSSLSNTPRWIQCTCAPLGGVLGMVLGHAAEGEAGAQRQRWRGRRAVGAVGEPRPPSDSPGRRLSLPEGVDGTQEGLEREGSARDL